MHSLKQINLSAAFVALTSCSIESADVRNSGAHIHLPTNFSYYCSEHWGGQLKYLGDALGTDCIPAALEEVDGRLWMRKYSGDGSQNSDWFGYGAEVLAPCNCTVESITVNTIESFPGQLGKPPATFIVFASDDGLKILYAHVCNITVVVGERVEREQFVAEVGNNGYS